MTARWPLMVVCLAAMAASATPARAGGKIWFTNDECSAGTRPRQAKPEWKPELCKVNFLEKLDCHGLAHFAEWRRHVVNREVLGAYNRPLSSLGLRSGPAATTPEPTPPPPPPSTTAAPPSPSPTAPSTSPSPLPDVPTAPVAPK